MRVSFKPRLEALEDRLAMSTAATTPAPSTGSEPLPVLMVIANQDYYPSFPSSAGSLAATPPAPPGGNTYYVGTANGGVWKATDGGSSGAFDPATATWYLKNANSPGAPSTGGSGPGVYKTMNGGMTWSL